MSSFRPGKGIGHGRIPFNTKRGDTATPVVSQDQIYPEFPLDWNCYESPDGCDEDKSVYDFYCDQSVISNNSVVVVLDIIIATEWNIDDVDLDESTIYEFYQAQAPPADNEVSFDTKAEFPSQAEEPEDEYFGIIDTAPPPDNEVSFDTRVFVTDQSEEPEDEAFGFDYVQVDTGIAVVVDQIYTELSAEAEQLEDEDYGFIDYQLGVETAVAADQIYQEFTIQEEQPEDEDYGFINSQVPPDNEVSFDTKQFLPDQSEELEDEDFGLIDTAPPADNEVSFDTKQEIPSQSEEPDDESLGFEYGQVGTEVAVAADQIYQELPVEAEEQEAEDFGFVDSQIPPDNEVSFDVKVELPSQVDEPEDEPNGFEFFIVGTEVVLAPDQIYQEFPVNEEQPEEEDFGFTDYQLGVDVTVTDQIYTEFPSQAEEPEDEDYGFIDYQLGVDFAVADLNIIWPYDASEQQEENENDFDSSIQYDQVFQDAAVVVIPPVGGMIGGVRRKRKVIIDGKLLNLDDSQLKTLLMMEVKKLPITPKVLTGKKKKSKTKAKLVESYFPNYKELSERLDTRSAKLLKDILDEEVKRFEEEEFILLVMLKLWT